ncbi:MAG: ferredoxin family protein [Myxococcota bacterium]
MATVITNICDGVCDTACVDVCPVDCIHGPIATEEIRKVPHDERAKRFAGVQLFIDPEVCIDCGACSPECPANAIFLDLDVPDEHRASIEANAAFFRPTGCGS